MKDEIIVSKGDDFTQVYLTNIVSTYNILVDKVNENDKTTVNASMYLQDVGFLLKLIKNGANN